MEKKNLEVDKDEIMLVDKPAGISSFGVVARVRRKLSEEAGYIDVTGKDGIIRRKRKKVKVGHTGTLDPFATGLLILLIGKGTKRANEFLKLDKEYIAKVKLGEVSDTGDLEGDIRSYYEGFDHSSRDTTSPQPAVAGETRLSFARGAADGLEEESQNLPASRLTVPIAQVEKSSESVLDLQRQIQEFGSDLVGEGKLRIPSRERVREVVKSFIGEIEQQVPNYSAVKINGQRAYKLAREGKKVEMPVRKVKIYDIEILKYEWPYLEIRCEVSSGTYIRALGADIGKALGVGGYLTELRRTKIDKYCVEDAIAIGL